MVLFHLLHGWIYSFETLSTDFDWYDHKVVHWTSTTFVCGLISLATIFLTHFHLPIRYEMGTDLLTSLRQKTSTHISDHIHEWRRRRRLIKSPIRDQILVDWFMKSLLPPIAWDVAMGNVVTEEQSISHSQYLDLVYSQSKTLYDIIPQGPCLSTDPT